MKQLFTDNWYFAKKHIEDPALYNALPDSYLNLPDTDFTSVSVPHDYLIYNSKDLYENSVGIYKKNFSINSTDSKRRFLRFDGIYMDSTIFINKQKAFEWKYGYTAFEVDITDFVKSGENEVIIVTVYKCPNSRWYSGAGLFREVTYIERPALHLVADGVYLVNKNTDKTWTTSINTEALFQVSKATSLCTDVCKTDSATVTIKHTLYSQDGSVCATSQNKAILNKIDTTGKPYFFLEPENYVPVKEGIGPVLDYGNEITGAASGVAVDKQSITIENPHLWDVSDPYLYTLTTELINENGNVIDSDTTRTGYRTAEFDKDKGFLLNGKKLKLNGACQHHDLGALGSAFNKSALLRQFKKMARMGINAIRTSHNPTATGFMELADEFGMLIISECFDMWEKPKTTYDYGNYFIEWHKRDVASWIRRDRNHTSIIMWSIGNEIYDTHQGNGIAISKDLTALVHTFDYARNKAVTIGSNYIEWDGAQRCMQEVDTAGYNYAERLYEDHHKKYPEWKIYGSETASTVQSRGVYHFPASFRMLTHDDLQCSCLGNCSTNWGAPNTTRVITADRDTPFSAGQFIWTGWDYIGEPTPYFTKNSFFGQIDTAGFEKDTFYVYQGSWTDYHKTPMVHILPYWDFNPNQLIDIRIYSNAPETELFFNDKSYGKYKIDHAHGVDLSGKWSIPYEKGTITAVAYDENGIEIARDSRSTFSDPKKIILELDKDCEVISSNNNSNDNCSSNDNLLFVMISTVDEAGIPVANARNRIKVEVKGGKLLGLDNGDSTDYDQYKCDNRRLFNNGLVAIIQADKNSIDGKVVVTASSADLPVEILTINTMSTNSKYIVAHSTKEVATITSEIPIRKIELIRVGSGELNPNNPSCKVVAKIYPENATNADIVWKAMRLEGVASPAAKITVEGLTATINAVADGEFRLRATAANGRDHPEVVSELEFSITGLGRSTIDPFSLVAACEHTSCLIEPKLSFQGGSFMPNERNWLSFENVDFGDEGSDEITIPVFSFNTTLPLEIWEGCPDKDGTLLSKVEYNSPSWYNHYQSNTWKLPRRLFGVHTISIVSFSGLSMQGFKFEKSSKAYACLQALDNTLITGDSFTLGEDAITDIGNNVTLEFNSMDFGFPGPVKVALCGRATNGNNSVHLKFTPLENTGTTISHNQVLEIPYSKEYKEYIFKLDFTDTTKIFGKFKVSFVFLPGSKFDFKWFKFER